MAQSLRRREFIAGSLAAATAGSLAQAAPADGPAQEYYELRSYRTANAEKQALVNSYLETALAPALKRMGIDRIGGFMPIEESDHSAHILIPFKSLDQLGAVNDKLEADKEYHAAAAKYFAAPKNDPAFSRVENRLMKAFAGMPVLELPPQTATKAKRVFELRIYESHNEHAARLKVEMFNKGEIDIMRDVKLAPVFYGETLVSNDVPNLTYMLSGESVEAHKAHFQAFLKHPEWDRMKKLKRYRGTVSKITSVYMQPTDWSSI